MTTDAERAGERVCECGAYQLVTIARQRRQLKQAIERHRELNRKFELLRQELDELRRTIETPERN